MEEILEIIAEMTRRGFVYYDWNVSSGDATSKALSAGEIYQNVVPAALGNTRSIVLMHDSGYKTTTVAALDNMIETLQKNGYTFDKLERDVKPVIFPYRDYKK